MNLRKKTFLLTALVIAGATGGILFILYTGSRQLIGAIERQQLVRAQSEARASVERLLSGTQAAARNVVGAVTLEDADDEVAKNLAAAQTLFGWDLVLREKWADDFERLVSSRVEAPHFAIDRDQAQRLRPLLRAADPNEQLESGAFLSGWNDRLAVVAFSQGPHRAGESATVKRWCIIHFLDTRDLLPAEADSGVAMTIRLTGEEPRAASGNSGRVEIWTLRDPSGKPIAELEFRSVRPLAGSVMWRVYLAMGLVALVGAALCLCMDRWVVRPVTRRLARVSYGLLGIQRSGNLASRVPVEGDDEIATLARETNRLLASAESSQRTLERVNAEMQQRVAERTAALADANAALEADIAERIKAEQERERLREQLLQAHKMEAVGTLAGGIAHDFNNILTGILGHAQLMSGDLSDDSPARKNLGHVISAAERASALVRQILAYSRQSPGERRPIAVSQVVRETLALLRAALPAGIEIKFDRQTKLDVVEADPTQLHQVFMNLGANAGQAIGSRGGELKVVVHRMELKAAKPGLVRTLPPGEYVCISFTDTGCGMTPEVMERIFDPFFSTKPVNQGTGLGLAVVHGIITEHGGTIEVDSEVGRGTCFRIWLPAVSSAADLGAGASAESLPGSERILLVDDEELVLSVMSNSLRRLGYRVEEEMNGPAALERFKQAPNDFELVITDQTMPQMSGLQLTQAIKAIRPEVPVILVTGYSPEVADKAAEELGVVGILGKPINFPELTSLIRKQLDRARSAHPMASVR